eukprot:5268439-Pyramimonas_sp.AAC.1
MALGGAPYKATKRVRGAPQLARWCHAVPSWVWWCHASATIRTFCGPDYGPEACEGSADMP